MVENPILTYDGKLIQNKKGGKENYPNGTIKLLYERVSVRSFQDEKVPQTLLNLILEAGLHSASAGNLQPYSIIVIKSKSKKEKLAKLCQQAFISKAPILLMFTIDMHRLERWANLECAPFTANNSFRHFWVSFQDVIICAQSICTAAESVGLGSVYIGSVLEAFSEIRELLKLPDKVFPVVLLCIGYPKTRPLPQQKLGLRMIVHNEKYKEQDDSELLKAFNKKYERIKVKIDEERLKVVEEVCNKVQGKAFASRCLELIKRKGYINPAQYYFALHYRADLMPEGNDTYLDLMEKAGFKWFKKYNPSEE
ncbi:MAG: nitroreductase family protein [Nitrososphaeria archaeon]